MENGLYESCVVSSVASEYVNATEASTTKPTNDSSAYSNADPLSDIDV